MAPVEAVDVVMRMAISNIGLIWRKWRCASCGHRIIEWGQPVLTDSGDLFVDNLIDFAWTADTTVVRVGVVVFN